VAVASAGADAVAAAFAAYFVGLGANQLDQTK
jgi:hypothetical protein